MLKASLQLLGRQIPGVVWYNQALMDKGIPREGGGSMELQAQAWCSFSSFALAAPAGETAERTDVRFVLLETTVESMPNQGENLGFDLFPFLDAVGRANATHGCDSTLF